MTTDETPTGTFALKQERAATRARELSDLMARRPELAGVHPAADLTAEAARWCA